MSPAAQGTHSVSLPRHGQAASLGLYLSVSSAQTQSPVVFLIKNERGFVERQLDSQ